MSLIQTAFIEKNRVPDSTKLEEAIRALGFDLAIDESYRPFISSGYLPCVLNGRNSGFEINFESPDDMVQAFPHLQKEIGGRECAIAFRWGGDMTECACVLIVGAALAKNFGANIHYEADDLLYSAEQLIEDAKSVLRAI